MRIAVEKTPNTCIPLNILPEEAVREFNVIMEQILLVHLDKPLFSQQFLRKI
jgi:hypothetical protein